MNYNACSAQLTQLKSELVWLKEFDSTALQSSLKDLDIAYQNFFRESSKESRRLDFQNSKTKSKAENPTKQSETGKQFKLLEKHIKLPKFGLIRCAVSKQVEGRILSAMVSQNPSEKYFVSVCCTDVEIEQYPSTNQRIGLDLGFADFAIASTGESFVNPKHLRKSEKRLVKYARELSRKTIGSNNRTKAKRNLVVARDRDINAAKNILKEGLHLLGA